MITNQKIRLVIQKYPKWKILIWLLIGILIGAVIAIPLIVWAYSKLEIPEAIVIETPTPEPPSPREYLRREAEKLGIDFGLADRIIKCESGWQEKICNKTYGCKSGQGLFQLIPSTVEHASQMLGREIDPFNPYDNIDAGLWLIKNEGLGHWRPYSGACWER